MGEKLRDQRVITVTRKEDGHVERIGKRTGYNGQLGRIRYNFKV